MQTHSSNDNIQSEKDSNKKESLSSVGVPKLPFDVDLYHWEDSELPVPRILP